MSDSLGDFSLFELFKQEAEAHCAALNDGLLALERDPSDVSSIEPLMRAAHSIKGAARIIGFDTAVTLAHAMEDCFVTVQKGQEQLSSGRVDQLLQGVDILARLAELTENGIEAWSSQHAAAIETLSAALRTEPPGDPASATAEAPATTTPLPPSKAPAGVPADMSLFELFKEEAETHCAALSDGLLAMERDPADVSNIDNLMRAAHSIKGAARIIGFDIAVQLAHAMEDRFLGVQKGSETLTAGRVDQLLAGVDLLERIGTLTEDRVEQWSAQHGAAITELATALMGPAPQQRVARPAPPASAPPPAAQEPEAAPTTSEPGQREEAVVRVSAHNLDRMMQLASETMIASRRFDTLSQGLSHLRELQRRLGVMLGGRNGRSVDVEDLRGLNREVEQAVGHHAVDLEQAAWRAEKLSTSLYNEVLSSRMRPFSEGVTAFPRLVRDLARSLGKKIRFEVRGEAVRVDRDIMRKLEAPLNHMVRNAVDHGIEMPDVRLAAGKPAEGHMVLSARHHAGMLTVEVRDDGRGIDPESVRRRIVDRQLIDESMAAKLSTPELMDFLFLPGFSTRSEVTEVSGRGVGLDVVKSMVQEVSGTIQLSSEPGLSTTFTFRLPVTLSVIRAALASVAGELFAFPLSRLVRVVRVATEEVSPVEGRQQFQLDGESVGLVSAAAILGLNDAGPTGDWINIVVIGQVGQLCGLTVDGLVGEQDLVVRPLDERLGKVPHISSAALLEDGTPILIIDVDDMLTSMQLLLHEGRMRGVTAIGRPEVPQDRQRILVVDDSITVREVERQLLKKHGYDVEVAVDGQDGWNTLRSGHYDLMISDVDMPRMTGIELIRQVRADMRFQELPIIIVSYKDREEDRLAGMDAGADAYLTKASFQDDSLIETVATLLREN